MPDHPVAPPSNRLDWHSPREWFRWFARTTKRLLVLAFGVAILGAGVAMLALPGPGLLVVIVGLAVLATEFAWAEQALDRTTTKAANAASTVSSSRSGRLALIVSGVGMFMGGALVAALVGDLRVIGISIGLAGLIGLATLLPGVRRWIDARTTTTRDPAVAAIAIAVPVPVPTIDPLSPESAPSSTTDNGAPS